MNNLAIDGWSDVLDIGDPSIQVEEPERWTDATEVLRRILGLD